MNSMAPLFHQAIRYQSPRGLSQLNLLSSSFTCNQILSCSKSTAAAAAKYYVASTTLSLMAAYGRLQKKLQGAPVQAKTYAADTVVLYQFPRAYRSPSLSMFALKLETWCRAAGVKYTNEFGMKRSSQGLIPFIRLNDYVVEDSQKCIEYLSKVMPVDMNARLSDEQRAVARLVLKLCDDSLRWSVVLMRFWHAKNPRKELGLPLLAVWFFSYRVYRAGLYSGYSKYTRDELAESGRRDMRALDTLIGAKKFLLDDVAPCDADFAIFGLCAQIKYNDTYELNQCLTTECPNLLRHIDNVKETYWPDWDANTRIHKLRTVKQAKVGWPIALFNKKVEK